MHLGSWCGWRRSGCRDPCSAWGREEIVRGTTQPRASLPCGGRVPLLITLSNPFACLTASDGDCVNAAPAAIIACCMGWMMSRSGGRISFRVETKVLLAKRQHKTTHFAGTYIVLVPLEDCVAQMAIGPFQRRTPRADNLRPKNPNRCLAGHFSALRLPDKSPSSENAADGAVPPLPAVLDG